MNPASIAARHSGASLPGLLGTFTSDVTSYGRYLQPNDAAGRVTLDRQNVPLREVLDAVCAQVGCVCGRGNVPHVDVAERVPDRGRAPLKERRDLGLTQA
jgi:hypothetical protein